MPKVGGMYQGVNYILIDTTYLSGQERADTFFEKVVGARMQDSVVNIVYVPTDLFNTGGEAEESVIDEDVLSFLTVPTTVDGYTPKNKKLLTYPYICLGVDCLSDAKTYRYEWFENGIAFTIKSAINAKPEIGCAPNDYDGIVSGYVGYDDNPTEQLVISDFPQCAFTIDSYRAWVAQRAATEGLGMIGTVAGAVGQALTGNWLGALQSTVSAASQGVTSYKEATVGNKTRGNQGGSLNAATNRMDFYFKKMGITANYARAIDDFFSRFGYATKRLKVPNRAVRPHWTYTKTSECTIRGAVPTDAMSKINSIYNNGITFWRNASEVGNYSLDNSPV